MILVQFYVIVYFSWASLVAQMVKHLPAVQQTWVRFLGWEDLLQKGMATHSSILAWRIPWTEEPGGLQSMDGIAKSLRDTTEQVTLSLSLFTLLFPTHIHTKDNFQEKF